MTINFSDKSAWNPANPSINATNVVSLGQVNSVIQGLGGTVLYGSQADLGKRICFSEAEILKYTTAANGNLYGGIFVPVFVSAAATAGNIAAGLAAFPLDSFTNVYSSTGLSANYTVTDEAHANSINQFCGVFVNAITPGNFGLIQIHGKCVVQYRAAVTAAVAGATVVVQGAGTGVFDAIANATTITGGTYGTVAGNALSLPANGALGTVFMRNLHGRY